MKILILTNYANGLWLFRKELLLACMGNGHDVHVSLPPDENVDKLRALAVGKRRIEIIETPFERRGNNPVKDFGLFMAYRKLLKKLKPDIVLTYTIKPNLYGGLACRLEKIPYLCNITGLGTAIESGGLLSGMLLRFYRLSMANAQRVFFQNMKNMEFMNRCGVARKNSRLLPGSGVNLNEHKFCEYPSERKGIRFLAVLRIMKDKGIDEYLNAAKIIKGRERGVKFWLVGEYEEETRGIYEPQIRALEKDGVIKYFGHVDNVAQIMAKSHVIVHPSYHEGLSNVLLEAAACGRPVLASDIGGCIETFCEGESGYAFDIKSTDALVLAIEKILSLNKEQRRQMGITGRAWAEEKFDRNIVLKAYDEEINKAFERGKN